MQASNGQQIDTSTHETGNISQDIEPGSLGMAPTATSAGSQGHAWQQEVRVCSSLCTASGQHHAAPEAPIRTACHAQKPPRGHAFGLQGGLVNSMRPCAQGGDDRARLSAAEAARAVVERRLEELSELTATPTSQLKFLPDAWAQVGTRALHPRTALAQCCS